MYTVERITIEVVSAVACFILFRYMIKPFRLTQETRYLGLPLGFGFLGVSYAFSALSYCRILPFTNSLLAQLLVRAYAFLFLLVTYYFSKSAKKPKLLWNTSFGILIAVFAVLILLMIISPQFSRSDYKVASVCVRFFSLVCLLYISIHALKSHIEQSDSTTLLIPLGYVLYGIAAYSALISAVERSLFALFGGLVLRLAALAVFIFVSYRTFHCSERGKNEENSATR